MKALLEKWYLDFTSPEATGFYYIMRISLGPFRFGLSGINHFVGSRSLQSFRFSRIRRSGYHVLDLGHACLTVRGAETRLHIRHGKLRLSGKWRNSVPAPPRPRKPLYQSSRGRCDWKIWAPKADVELELTSGKEGSLARGTGYIDFVRSSFPAWNVPFRRLYWGRIHSRESWGVFLALQTSDECVAFYLDPWTVAPDIEVRLIRDSAGCAQHMEWILNRSDAPSPIRAEITRVLESQGVLSKGGLLNLLPANLRRKLSSAGRDEKYEVRVEMGGQPFWGIMEEVRWNES